MSQEFTDDVMSMVADRFVMIFHYNMVELQQ